MRQKKLISTGYEIHSGRIPGAFDGFRLAVLADLHNCEIGEDNSLLLSALREAQPDVILAAGDFITEEKHGKRRVYADCAGELISELLDIAPVYMGIGNHEKRWQETRIEGRPSWESWSRKVEEEGAVILDNRSVRLHRGDGMIRITGLSLPLRYYKKVRKPRLTETEIRHMAGMADPEHFQILLAHTPEYGAAYGRWGADLSLAGHYHGGLVRLPVLGGVIDTGWHLFPRFDRGRFPLHGGEMIVSAGLGSHSIPLRINNPPELVVITLHGDKEV